LRSSNPNLHRPFKVPLSPIVPILTVLSAAYLMNSLPLDTWIRLIDWMAIGLVVYFAYSYNNSHLGKLTDTEANVETPVEYEPPVAAIVGIVLAIVLTIWQVNYLMTLREDVVLLNLAVRLFAWVITGVMVVMLMYGKVSRHGGRNAKTRNIGLILSLLNLAIWAGITYWYFAFHHTPSM
jgi:hypothetical protein